MTNKCGEENENQERGSATAKDGENNPFVESYDIDGQKSAEDGGPEREENETQVKGRDKKIDFF